MTSRRLCQLASLARRQNKFSEKTQTFAAAITATEMQFRPFWQRSVEYIYVLLLILLGRDAGSISIGVSQISIRHIVSIEGTNQLEALLWALSARNSIGTCCKIIEAINTEDLDQVRVAYNGVGTTYYRKVLQRNYGLLQKLEKSRLNKKNLSQRPI